MVLGRKSKGSESGKKSSGGGLGMEATGAEITPEAEDTGDSDAGVVDEGGLESDSYDAIEVLPAEREDEEETEPDTGSSRALKVFDPFEAYLREISRYHPLKPDEEHEIALDYYKNKSREAALKLISSNLWLVVKIARDYEKAARNVLDLVQEGNIGLMEAVKNFDPYRGVRFPSYAVWWIKAYIIRFVIANWRLVKIGTTQAQRKLFFNLKKERDRLEREGFYPGAKLIAQNLNVRESEVVEMEQRLSGADVSVDAPLQNESEGSLLGVLDSGELSAEELLSRKQMRKLLLDSLEEFGATLNEKELIIFRQRMLSEEKATLQEIADQLDISKERVRQLENRIKDKLKTYLLGRLGPDSENIDLES